MHAIPSWGGFITAELRGALNAMLRRAYRYGHCHKPVTVEEIMEAADGKLFAAIQHPAHCIHFILPQEKEEHVKGLRRKGHTFQLPHYTYDMYRKSLIPRCLLKYV